MIRVVISGVLGKMGRTLLQAVDAEEEMTCVGGLDLKEDPTLKVPMAQSLPALLEQVSADVLVDFTVRDAAYQNIKEALLRSLPCVVGTTGLTQEMLQEIAALCQEKETPCFIAPNFSLGAVLMMDFAKQAANYFPQVEIIEYHHPQKKDAPSGTAIRTAELLQKSGQPISVEFPSRGEVHSNVPVHSVRLPGFVAHQEVIFGGEGELLTLRHDSLDRICFMRGVLLAIRKIQNLRGLVIGLEQILESDAVKKQTGGV